MKTRRPAYTIEVEADAIPGYPISVYLDEFDVHDILDYVENVLNYTVTKPDNSSTNGNVLDEVTKQLKNEFFEGLDFHQLDTLVKNKKEVIEYIRQLSVASEK